MYIYGDTVNDHGYYNVYLNNSATPYANLYDRGGCGGVYAKACEKLHVLKFFAGPLPQGLHQVTLVNEGPSGDNATFFGTFSLRENIGTRKRLNKVDFDYAEYTTPSIYSSAILVTNASCPFTQCDNVAGITTNTISATGGTGLPSGTATGSAAPSSSSKAAGELENVIGIGSVWAVLGVWVLKRFWA